MKIYKKGYIYIHRLGRRSSDILASPALTTFVVIFTAIIAVVYLV